MKQLAGPPAKMNETQPPVGLRSVLSHSSTIKLWMNGARTVGARWMTGPPANLWRNVNINLLQVFAKSVLEAFDLRFPFRYTVILIGNPVLEAFTAPSPESIHVIQ